MERMRVPTVPALMSRWAALALVIGAILALIAWLAGGGGLALWILLVSPVVAGVGLFWPDLAIRPYDAWDWLERRARRVARLWLTGVVFGSIAAMGRLGSNLAREAPRSDSSGWIPKKALPDESYGGDADVPLGSARSGGWIRRYVTWAWRSGNTWSWSLIPSLLLLKAIEGGSRGSLGGDVYTLY